MHVLSVNEEILLVAILGMKDEAYGYAILKSVMDTTGKKVVYGTLYNSMDNLVKKGYITVHKGEPTAERGGKRKVYYRLTKYGKRALVETREFHLSLLHKMSGLAPE
jgi:PadR family transcriptional regulator